MRNFYSVVSLVFVILSMVPLIVQYDYEWVKLVTFDQKGLIGMLLPIIYGLISIMFGFVSRKGTVKTLLLVFGVSFLILNSAYVFVAIFGFQDP
ncbi:hypothetical protein [Gracilibacillus dipsosauri]|uniref:Uncharacterized protein n=1 Tax=Gracilibacillus dipsosauri TaxID=178340 RepID=A0A317KUW5_9BACI|nr:hypothetical protein [Gracilibacillus dipsosauri]PWU67195.1 hypothetical protein DLJ74_16615 [Gracilibacillus dipsosauri]